MAQLAPHARPVTSLEPARAIALIAHLPAPADTGRALCGTPMSGRAAPRHIDRCVVCTDLATDQSCEATR